MSCFFIFPDNNHQFNVASNGFAGVRSQRPKDKTLADDLSCGRTDNNHTRLGQFGQTSSDTRHIADERMSHAVRAATLRCLRVNLFGDHHAGMNSNPKIDVQFRFLPGPNLKFFNFRRDLQTGQYRAA